MLKADIMLKDVMVTIKMDGETLLTLIKAYNDTFPKILSFFSQEERVIIDSIMVQIRKEIEKVL